MKACIFDLDGVIVDTAKYHFIAWKRLAESIGVEFNEHDNEQLKGLSRDASLLYILNKGNIKATPSEFLAWTSQKNEWYLELVHQMKNDEALPNAFNLINELKSHNIKIALGSASKNAMLILERINMLNLFESIIDGTKTSKSKPDPEVFLLAAEALNCTPDECVVFEDAIMGVRAAKTGGFHCVGIGTPDVLVEADLVIPDLTLASYAWLTEKF